MARSEAFRKYLLTINNPEEHGLTHEVLKSTLQTFEGCLYWCLCDEIGEQGGTYHTHLYLAFRNAVMFDTMQQRFYGAHIDGARGSHLENRNYVRKEGKWKDDPKRGTNLPDTFEESGDLPEERSAHVKQSEKIFAMIQDGASNAKILRELPSALFHVPSIEAARQTLLEEQYRTQYRQMHVEYMFGKTGVGKTRGIMEKYGYENVCRTLNYAHPFDNYACQDVLLLDEFRSSLPISDMLNFLDGYPLMLPCRYSDKVACFTKVFVVSNISFEKQYPNIQVTEPETWEAFKRRFHAIYEKLPDDGHDGLPF